MSDHDPIVDPAKAMRSALERQDEALRRALGRSGPTEFENLQRSIDSATGKNMLVEIDRHQKALRSALNHTPLPDFQKIKDTLDTATGKNLLTDIDRHQKTLNAALNHNPIPDFQKIKDALDAATGKTLLAEINRQKTAVKTGFGHIAPGKDKRQASIASDQVATVDANEPKDSARSSGGLTAPQKTPGLLSSVADLGALVRQRRKTMGLTQQQFADLTGVGRRFIIELENGKPTLEFGRVLKVCQAIGIDLTAVSR